GEGLGGNVLQVAPELPLQRLLRQVGDVRRHARHGEPVARLDAELEVAALRPVGIGHHRLAAVAIGTAANTRSLWREAHCSTCMPPIDPPITQKSSSIPK